MESIAPIEMRYRWWRDPRWIILILVAATGGMVLWGLFGPEPKLIVSRETTLITEPLRPDGTPDYAAHVLDLLGRNTPPEENAAVAVLHATWPMGLDAEDLAAVCKALGIPDTPPDVPSLDSADNDKALRDELRAFLGLNVSDDGIPMHSDDEAIDRVIKLIDDARIIPWTQEECPLLAAWVARQSPALDLIVEGATRPKYELPLPDLLRAEPGTMLIGVVMHGTQRLRDVCRVLIMRAMLHLGEGRMPEAWRDIHAVHRLARLIAPAGRPRFLITHLVAIAIEGTANAATFVLLESPGLTAAMAASIRRDLESLPAPPDIRSSQAMERLGIVDLVVAIARMPRSERSGSLSLGGIDELGLALGTSLDMNVVLRTINDAEDRIEKALSLPDHQARCQAMDQIITEITARPFGPGGWEKAAWLAQAALSRGARSTACARSLLGFLVSPTKGVLDAYERRRAEAAILRLAAALAEYRGRGLGGEGRPYPDSLEGLVPEVVATVPEDPCSGKPFRYERRGDGYLLYSVGPDGADDGGTNDELVRGEWRSDDDDADTVKSRDIAVRMPRPKRGLIPPPSDAGK